MPVCPFLLHHATQPSHFARRHAISISFLASDFPLIVRKLRTSNYWSGNGGLYRILSGNGSCRTNERVPTADCPFADEDDGEVESHIEIRVSTFAQVRTSKLKATYTPIHKLNSATRAKPSCGVTGSVAKPNSSASRLTEHPGCERKSTYLHTAIRAGLP